MKYAYRITAAAVGVVLGAGFLSGQELLRFFGAFGVWGYVGTGLAAVFFYLTVTAILNIAHDSGLTSTDRVVLFFDVPLARRAIICFEFVFLFLIYVLMIAAAGSLFADVLSMPSVAGNLLFCVLTVVCSLFGVSGLVRVFSLLVPVLVVATLAVAAGGLGIAGWQAPTPSAFSVGFAPSALVYVSFNVVCSIPILAPVGKNAPTKASIRLGTAVASIVLTLIAVLILAALGSSRVSSELDLPMLTLATSLGRGVGLLYALLLFGGIFSTGLSALTALNTYFAERWHLKRGTVAAIAASLSLLGVVVALSGFRQLVGFFYPVFGYIGLLPLLLLFLHAFLRFRRKKKHTRNEKRENGQESQKQGKGENV